MLYGLATVRAVAFPFVRVLYTLTDSFRLITSLARRSKTSETPNRTKSETVKPLAVASSRRASIWSGSSRRAMRGFPLLLYAGTTLLARLAGRAGAFFARRLGARVSCLLIASAPLVCLTLA